MSKSQNFSFQYPVNVRNRAGKIVLLDTVTVNAIAYLYSKDGTVRRVDVESVLDSEGQEVTKWVPFMEVISGDLDKEIEDAAMAHIVGKLESVEFELIEQ